MTRTVDEVLARDGELDGAEAARLIAEGLAALWRGRMLPPRHDHDAEDAAATQADAAVTKAIQDGVARMRRKEEDEHA